MLWSTVVCKLYEILFLNYKIDESYEAVVFFKLMKLLLISGLSQSYVSRYMRGEFEDFSDRSRKAIYKFYLAFRKYPAAIGKFHQI